MAAQRKNLETSTPNAGENTSSEKQLDVEQALEILQKSLRIYQRSGGRVEIIPQLWHGGECYLAIAIPGVTYSDGDLSISGSK